MYKDFNKFLAGNYPQATKEGKLMMQLAFLYIVANVLLGLRFKMQFSDLILYTAILALNMLFAVLNINCIAGNKKCTTWAYVSLVGMAMTTLYSTYLVGIFYSGPIYISGQNEASDAPL